MCRFVTGEQGIDLDYSASLLFKSQILMLETAQGSGKQPRRRQQYDRERCLEHNKGFAGE